MARLFLTALDLNKNELQNAVVQNLAAAPGTPVLGQLYYDTVGNALYLYNGAWANVATGAGTTFGTVTAQTTYGLSSANGVAASASRSDHVHGTPALTAITPSTQAVGDAAAVGTGTAPAREDHKHAMPAFGAATAQTTFGLASTNGVGTGIARNDHAHGTPAHDAAAHAAIKISDLAAPTATVSMGSQTVSNVATPTVATDAANKGYVDATVQGLDIKASVRVATTAAGTLASSFANLSVVDGVTLATGDRILIKNQAAGAENGIYVVAASGAPTRAVDFNSSTNITSGAFTFVEAGTTLAGTGWVLTTTGVITVGTTALTFAQFSGAGTYIAGNGLTLTGNTFAVGAGSGILSTAGAVAVDTAVVVRKYATTLATSATSYTVTHNLGTQDVTVSVYAVGTPYAEVMCDVQHTSTNTITVLFSVAPAANTYRVVVHA